MTGDFLTKPNQGSIFKRFRDLIMGVIPQTEPSNGKQGNTKKNKLIKVNKIRRKNGRHDRYHKHSQECVANQQTGGDQNRIRIETGFESQKSVSQISIQRDME